ncbi:unnamed protein product [Mycena citricolor]|uniref:C3H1-type domain-containing protein n=1 Tax=Mycena citricolor TaxID=2018698 RepID=A0AAD2HEN1_9AGAR|nr:unnamed protein product [Mycena citricolor]CAK5282821.1 unnamed protein product [Mycena citricolor]
MLDEERERERDRDQDREREGDTRGGGGGKKSGGGGGGGAGSKSSSKDLSHVPCKFFKVGSCTAGSACPFSHTAIEPGATKDTCAWFVKGNCKFGHKCALAHILPGQSMSMDRRNKKAAQVQAAAAGGGRRDGGEKGGRDRDRDRAKRGGAGGDSGLNARTPARRPPMSLQLKATISPSAPAPPLKDTDFASFSDVLDELPSAPARNKSPDSPPVTTAVTTPKEEEEAKVLDFKEQVMSMMSIPVSAPRRPSTTTPPAKDFGPIGSPPTNAGATPPQKNGFLSTSPFSAPGSQTIFHLGDKAKGMPSSLGTGITGAWGAPPPPKQTATRPPTTTSLLSAARDIQRNTSNNADDGDDSMEEFVPSSLSELLTPEERSRRMSRANSGQGYELSSSPGRQGLGLPLPSGAAGHRYSRSVPAPSFLGGDLKSIWSEQASGSPVVPSGLASSPRFSSSYSSTGGGGLTGSYAEDPASLMRLPTLSPSNASAAFLPGMHHYMSRNKSNSGLASNAAMQQGPPGLAHYLQSGPSAYVRPNPFDLTQQQSRVEQPDAGLMSPNARALQAHAPGQSLPQGLAAGYSRIHALPPLSAGSPSPAAAAFGTSPNRDWATMSTGSVSGSPGFLSYMAPQKETLPFSYSAAVASRAAGGAGAAGGPSGRNVSISSPLARPVATANQVDDLFVLDD